MARRRACARLRSNSPPPTTAHTTAQSTVLQTTVSVHGTGPPTDPLCSSLLTDSSTVLLTAVSVHGIGPPESRTLVP